MNCNLEQIGLTIKVIADSRATITGNNINNIVIDATTTITRMPLRSMCLSGQVQQYLLG
jgi:hypothetical protein